MVSLLPERKSGLATLDRQKQISEKSMSATTAAVAPNRVLHALIASAVGSALARVRVLPELKRLLDITLRSFTQVAASENTGRPYLESNFQHTFAEIRSAAGLSKDLRYRDLRRTFATSLGATGCGLH